MRTRVKICGITRVEDALEASRRGADAIGLVFYPPSPRAVTIEQAAAVVRVLPPFVTSVALFVDEAPGRVEEILSAVRIDLVQFHREETPEYCEGFGVRYIKAVRMREGVDLGRQAERYGQAQGLLLDSYLPGVPGGTGERFDWQRIPAEIGRSIILAGGLSPANVNEAVTRVRPYGVDVSGGVESAKGTKDHDKIAKFMQEVRRADQ